MKKTLAAATIGASMMLLPQAAHGATTTVTPSATVTPPMSVTTVNNSPGDQTDPHVSGDWVVYTDFSSGAGRIRYHNLLTNVDGEIPESGASDSLPDISGTTATYVRFAQGSHSIMTYDVTAGGSPIELDPQPASNRREAAIGNRTVAWQDVGFNAVSSPEIVVYDLDTHVATRLTSDSLYDRDPAVSPDGNTITWSKCTNIAGGCDVWSATRSGGTWTMRALTTGNGESTLPDTNGDVAVYGRPVGTDGGDVFFQAVSGGTETELVMAGLQQNANISRDTFVFESYDDTAQTPNFEIYAYDLVDGQLYRLTNTPEDESLNDVSVAPDGTATVVFSRLEDTGDDNVYAERFVVPGEVPGPTFSAAVQPPIAADGSSVFKASRGALPVKFTLSEGGTPTCDLPPATLTVTRAAGPVVASAAFDVTGCQYHFNLDAKRLGRGAYTISIVIDGQQVGTASFTLE